MGLQRLALDAALRLGLGRRPVDREVVREVIRDFDLEDTRPSSRGTVAESDAEPAGPEIGDGVVATAETTADLGGAGREVVAVVDGRRRSFWTKRRAGEAS